MRTKDEALVPELDERRILRLLRPKMRQVDRAPEGRAGSWCAAAGPASYRLAAG